MGITHLMEKDSCSFDDLVTTNELSGFCHRGPGEAVDLSLPQEASGDDPRGSLSAWFDDRFGSRVVLGTGYQASDFHH
jgi:hypothetical protein